MQLHEKIIIGAFNIDNLSGEIRDDPAGMSQKSPYTRQKVESLLACAAVAYAMSIFKKELSSEDSEGQDLIGHCISGVLETDFRQTTVLEDFVSEIMEKRFSDRLPKLS